MRAIYGKQTLANQSNFTMFAEYEKHSRAPFPLCNLERGSLTAIPQLRTHLGDSHTNEPVI